MAAFLTQIKEIWDRLPLSGVIATIGGAVGTLALIGALVYYGTQPNYGVLFTDLKPADAQSIVEKLKTANVAYSLSNGGTMPATLRMTKSSPGRALKIVEGSARESLHAMIRYSGLWPLCASSS